VHVIVIIVMASSGIGVAILAVGAMSLLLFSTSGDHVENTINTVTRKALCYPTLEIYADLLAFGRSLDQQRIVYSQQQIDDVLKNYGVISIKKGTKVKVFKNVGYYEGQLKAVLYNVIPVDSQAPQCLVKGEFLEMELQEWVKWKWRSS